MKKVLSIVLTIILLSTTLFTLSGCNKEEEKKSSEENKNENTVEISVKFGNGTITVNVPKNEDGTAKYNFTKEKPEGISKSGSFYLVTDTTVFGFATSGLAYNSSKYYREKYGETKATFDGYLEFLDDTSISSRPNLPGLEKFELNGRKALRYYNRTGGSGEYEYYGYFYMVAVDDIYPGSKFDLTVNYKDERPSEVQEFDKEALDIIKSLKITLNQ